MEHIVRADAGRVRDVVRGDAFDEFRQLHPVAALQRHRFHLAAVDVAGDLRRGGIDERRFAGHRDRFADLRQLHDERHRCVLADEQFHRRNDDRREAGQLGLQLVFAGRQLQQPVLAVLPADRNGLAAGFEVGGRDGRARQDRLGFVGDGADDGRFLRARRPGGHEKHPHGEEQETMRSHSTLLKWSRKRGEASEVLGAPPRGCAVGRAEDRRDSVADQGTNRGCTPRHEPNTKVLDHIIFADDTGQSDRVPSQDRADRCTRSTRGVSQSSGTRRETS